MWCANMRRIDPASAMRPGAQRQALERDHRVAAPVGEPVIAGDHRPRLVAGGARADVILAAAGGPDHELIGGEHELGGGAAARAARRRASSRRRRRSISAASASSRRHRQDRVPRLGRREQRDATARRESRRGTVPGCTACRATRSRGSPRSSTRCPAPHDGSMHERRALRRRGAGAAAAAAAARSSSIRAPYARQRIVPRAPRVETGSSWPRNCSAGPQLEPHRRRPRAGGTTIIAVFVAVRHDDALLDRRRRGRRSATPAGRARAGTRRARCGVPRRVDRRHPADIDALAVGQPELLGERVEHHHAAGRVRQRGDQSSRDSAASARRRPCPTRSRRGRCTTSHSRRCSDLVRRAAGGNGGLSGDGLGVGVHGGLRAGVGRRGATAAVRRDREARPGERRRRAVAAVARMSSLDHSGAPAGAGRRREQRLGQRARQGRPRLTSSRRSPSGSCQ